ncbi:MAG: diacylglycerol kinase family protein [Oscillospiraceae bacterium]|nr:diacylglycerol kinase family protein [Oscillospiraceae bacterium]
MDYKKILLIINPKAGITNHRYNIFDIIEAFCKKGCVTSTLTTLKEGDAVRLVCENAADHDMVVCSGGDGTINETVTALLRTGVNIPIGYIPSGSTNDMARTLELPLKPKKAAELIMEGSPKPFDIGLFGDDKYFCYTASFGAFTKVSYSTPQKLKNMFGHFAYVLSGVAKAAEELVPHKVKVVCDNFTVEGEFLLGGLFNARSVAGLIKLDKCGVDLSDGMFELILIRKPKNADMLYRTIKNLQKQSFSDETVIMRRVKSAQFIFEKPVGWSLDGEWGGEVSSVKIQNLKHAVSFFGRNEQ